MSFLLSYLSGRFLYASASDFHHLILLIFLALLLKESEMKDKTTATVRCSKWRNRHNKPWGSCDEKKLWSNNNTMMVVEKGEKGSLGLFLSDIFICSWVTNLYKISSPLNEWWRWALIFTKKIFMLFMHHDECFYRDVHTYVQSVCVYMFMLLRWRSFFHLTYFFIFTIIWMLSLMMMMMTITFSPIYSDRNKKKMHEGFSPCSLRTFFYF